VSRLYADTSALAKLIVDEPETAALIAHLRSQRPRLVTSQLAVTELLRVGRRTGRPEAAVWEVLDVVDTVALDLTVVTAAGRLEPAVLRSLDALHLATAEVVRAVCDGFLVYDRRLEAAAASLGWRTLRPGAP
jgi:predicted nucleic acid-binding protein